MSEHETGAEQLIEDAAADTSEASPVSEPAEEQAAHSAAARSAEAEQEEEELTWEQRVERLTERAATLDGEAAAALYVEAILLLDRKDPGDFQIAELWGDALQRSPLQARALWDSLSRRISTSVDVWEQISMAHDAVLSSLEDEAALAVSESRGWVQLLRSGELQAGKERLRPFAESEAGGRSALYLASVEPAEANNWRKAEQVFEDGLQAAGVADEAARAIETAHRLADVCMGMGSSERAVEVLRRVQRKYADDAGLRERLAVLYRDTEKWNAYVDLLKQGVESAPSVEARRDIFLEMVRVYGEKMNLDAMVVKTWEALLESDPGNAQAIESLASAYEASRRWPDLIALLQAQAEGATRKRRRVALNVRIAQTYLEKLSRHVDAIKFFELVLEDEPSHVEALTQLKDLYERRREWEKLIEIHKREIDALEDQAAKVERLKEVADIATNKLRKPSVASEIWGEVLDVSPGDGDALDALDGLYEREKDWANLAKVVERKGELEADADARSKLYQRLGGLFGDRLGDNAGAIRAWRKVLEIEPEHAKGVDSLRKLLIAEKAWDELVAFYTERGAHQDLVRVLETLANTSKDAADAVALRFRAADVWLEPLGAPERAVASLERVFELDAQNAEAAERLAPFYESNGDYAGLARMLEIQHAAQTSSESRVALAMRLAQLSEGELGNADAAFGWYTRTIAEAPAHVAAYDGLERVGAALERHAEVVDIYNAALEQVESPQERRELRLRSGALMADELGQIDEALAIFEEVLEVEPENLRALGSLERILERTGRYDELIAVNERRLRLATEPAEQAEILLSGARIHEFQRDDVATAMASYERVRELSPGDPRPLVELHRLYRQEARSEELANVLRARLALLDVGRLEADVVEHRERAEADEESGAPLVPEGMRLEGFDEDGYGILVRTEERPAAPGPDAAEAVGLWYELGQVAQSDLQAYDEAIDCYEKITLVEPEHEAARAALEALLAAEIEPRRVALILEPVYAYEADYEELVRVLGVQLETSRARDEQIELLVRIGRLQREELGDAEAAFGSFARALTLAPHDESIRQSLTTVAESLEAWERVAETYESIVDSVEDSALQTAYDLYLAQLWEHRLGDEERARGYGRRALERGGSDASVLETLDALYVRTGAWRDLIAVLEQKVAQAGDDAEAVRGLKHRKANVLEEMLGEREAAVAVYLEVLESEPADTAALDALDRLYADLESWDEAAANLGRRLELAEGEAERDGVNCRLARVLHERLGESERAIEIYREVMEREHERETAVADLERMLESADALSAEPISELLLPLYDAQDDWQKRAWADEMLLKTVEEPSRRVALLHEIAQLHETKGQDFPEAFVAYARAFTEAPDDEVTIEQLYRYAEALDFWRELVEVMESAASSIEDGELARATQVRVAQLYRDKLGDLDGATVAWEKASEYAPDDGSILDALEGIYREQQSWSKLTEVLAKKAARAEDAEEKKAYLFQAALICEEMLEEVDRAIEMLQEVLTIDAADVESVDGLERLYMSTERWEDLMAVYAIKIERATDAEEQKGLYYVVGALQVRERNDPHGAIETYRRVLDIDPDDGHALESLDALYTSIEDWMSLLEVLERQEAAVGDPDVKLTLRYRQGEVWHQKLESLERAIGVYESLLQVDGAHEETHAALESIIAESDEHAVAAAEVLRPVYESLAEWDRLVAVYEVMLRHADDVERRIELLGRIAQIREDMQQNAAEAFLARMRALREDAGRESTWEELERMGEAYELWEPLVEAADAYLTEVVESSAQIVVASRLARIYEQHLADNLQAIVMWNRVLEIDSIHEEAIGALDRLYEREQNFPELADILRREIELKLGDDAAVIALRLRLGTLYESVLEDVGEAIANYNEILLVEPGHEGAIEALRRMFDAGQGRVEIGQILEPYYRETEQWGELVEVALALVTSLETADDRYQKLLDIADIFTGPLTNPANALFVYGQALAERPGDEMALVRIEELAEATDGWGEAVEFFDTALQHTDDPLVQRELYWRIARGYDEKIGDPAQAESAYRSVLSLNPEHLAAWQALDRIYQSQARWDELVDVLKSEIQYNEDTFDQIGLYLRLGQAQYEMLEDGPSAIESFREVTALDPTNGEALSALERIHFERSEWEALYEVYGQQAMVANDDATRAEIWSKMANLASEVLERPQAAVEQWYQVLDARGGMDIGALRALEVLFERDQRWQDMADVVERQVPLCQSADEQIDVFRKLGRLWEGPLENDERALHYWRQGLDVAPYDLETLRAVKRIDEVLGDYEDLVQIIRRIVALDVLEHGEQLAHYVQLGEILTQVLVRPEEAIETWIQVLQLDSAHLQALNALEQLYVDQGAWESAVDALDRKAEVVADAEESIAIRMQIAEIWESQVLSPEQAAAALEQVIDMSPSHQDAFVRLEDLYTRMERWEGLLQLYIGRAEVLASQGEVEEQVDKLRRAASIAEERMTQPEMAFIVLQSALAANWRDESIASEFERLAEVTGNWRELIGLYDRIIAEVKDPTESLNLHNAVARWYFHKLGDANASWQHFQYVLQLDPNNRGALKELAEIYIRLGNWQELVNVQVQRAGLSSDAEEQVELFTQVAQVWEDNLENTEQAVAAYRKVLEIDEGNLNALDQLERIFQHEGRWQELVDVLKVKSTVLYEPEQVVRLRYRIGELWENALDNELEAIDAYRLVLEADEQHRESLDALVRLFTRLGRYQDLVGVYELQLNAANSDAERIALYTKLATVHEEEFQDVDAAIGCMQQITMIDPANLMAISTLERLYRDHGRFEDLIDVLQIHISVVDNDRERLELYQQLGEVFRDELKDVYRAIESFHTMLEYDPGHQGALAALADLYEYSAEWVRCIEILENLVAVVSYQPQQAVAIKFRIGRIYESQLSELDRAEENYQLALDIDAAFMPAIDALQNLYMQREDWQGNIRMLKQKVEYTRDLEEKAQLLCLIGQIYDQRIGDSINAIDYYEQTLQLSPGNIDAGWPLAGKYIREHKWARAEMLLETIIPRIGYSRDVENFYELHYWMGLACQELGQDEKALRHFRESYELNQAYLPTLLGMGRQLYKARDYERAYKTFQTVLQQYAHEISGEQLEELYFDSAQIKRDLGETDAARHMLQKVLELNPTHGPTLDAMIELSEAADDWKSVVYYKRHRMNVAADQTERFAELVEIADILRKQLQNTPEAIEAYREALKVEPSSKFVLLKLLETFTGERDWPNALATLERLCAVETSDERLSKFYYTMAIISRDEVSEDRNAVEYFNKCLDHNVNELRAFEAIDRILTAMKDWRELERNYRKMIKRVYDNDEGQFEDTKYLLWYGLAEIYRTRLTEWDNAVSAFQQASALRPKDPRMHRILAELYVRMGTADDNAIAEYRTLINMGPDPTDPYANAQNVHERNAEFYHNLFKLYLKTKQYDQAWCVANAMAYLGIASEEEKQFNERYLGPALVQAQGRLTPENWKLVYHPDENLRIGNVMNVMQAYCRDLFAYDLKKVWGLKKKDELDQNADFLFCKMYRYLAQAIGVIPAPKLYLNREQPLGLLNGNVDPPGFIVGADMMQGRSQRELAFIIARQLTLASPVHYLGGLRLPTETLKTFMMGAIQANTNPEASPNADIEAVVKAILKMPPPVRIDLGKIMKPVLEGRVQVNMSAWLKAIDHTANRVGLILCGDMAIAMQAIRNDAAPISKLSTAEKEAELVRYAISDEFFEVRKRLGLSIA